jgi:hypothetical protein
LKELDINKFFTVFKEKFFSSVSLKNLDRDLDLMCDVITWKEEMSLTKKGAVGLQPSLIRHRISFSRITAFCFFSLHKHSVHNVADPGSGMGKNQDPEMGSDTGSPSHASPPSASSPYTQAVLRIRDPVPL